jgi:metal-sulfur cluster biosynthetic enzyme
MFSKDNILKILTGVIHPGSGKDIVTLGMVSEVTTSEKGISILLTPEKSNDPFLSSLRSTIVKTLKDALGQGYYNCAS